MIPTVVWNSNLPAGSEFRFQLRDSNLGNGSSWKLRTVRDKGDVYLMQRESGRWIKASFHEDVSRWHYAVTEAGQNLSTPRGDPYLEVTFSHESIAEGWYHSKRIVVARSELRHWAEPNSGSRICGVEMPENCDATGFDLLLGDPGARPLSLDSKYRVLAVLERGDGGLAVLIQTPLMLDYTVHESLKNEIAQARFDLKKFGWDGTPTRIVIMVSSEEDGPQKEIEVALDSE